LKQKITENPTLALPYFLKLLEVKFDTIEMAIRVVLSQEDNPTAYFNENLNVTKQKYSSYDK
jgi:hypothetical protein